MAESPYIERNQNVLHFQSLSNPFVVGNFIRAVYKGRERGFEDFVLDCSAVSGTFPNVCVPIAGLLDVYRDDGVEFSKTRVPEFLENTRLFNPAIVIDSQLLLSQRPLNTVWRYSTPEEVNTLVTTYLREVSRIVVCEVGVIQGLEWCLNEVMDNVLQHSNQPFGYVMGQIHQTSKHIAFCIFDPGIGIFNTLKGSVHAPRSHLDAITLAIKEGVTRDKAVGQGNGMWGLHSIVRENSGSLGITTGNASYRIDRPDAPPYTSENVPFLNKVNNCTIVDFQIDFSKPIAVSRALGGHEPVNLALEELEDNAGQIVYPLANRSTGTGTRRSGLAIRNEVLNLSRQSNQIITLDFSGVGVVSSSFADELIGKLVAEIGFIGFGQRFRLINMNNFVETLTNRAVMQRLSATNTGEIG
jgi:hypothetical protein